MLAKHRLEILREKMARAWICACKQTKTHTHTQHKWVRRESITYQSGRLNALAVSSSLQPLNIKQLKKFDHTPWFQLLSTPLIKSFPTPNIIPTASPLKTKNEINQHYSFFVDEFYKPLTNT